MLVATMRIYSKIPLKIFFFVPISMKLCMKHWRIRSIIDYSNGTPELALTYFNVDFCNIGFYIGNVTVMYVSERSKECVWYSATSL